MTSVILKVCTSPREVSSRFARSLVDGIRYFATNAACALIQSAINASALASMVCST